MRGNSSFHNLIRVCCMLAVELECVDIGVFDVAGGRRKHEDAFHTLGSKGEPKQVLEKGNLGECPVPAIEHRIMSLQTRGKPSSPGDLTFEISSNLRSRPAVIHV